MQSGDMDLAFISPPQEETARGDQQTMKVYLRVRPFSKEEISDNEDQDCIVIENDQMVTLQAPKGSANLKCSEKGIATSVHKFSFSRIFGPETTQAELYDHTVQSQMSDFLDGENLLIFSYGVTNAGKTFTIQGTSKEPGILPRVLDATFEYITGRQYEGMDVKPYLRNDTRYLDAEQVKQEKSAKDAIFASFGEECEPLRPSSGSDPLPCSIASTSQSSDCQSGGGSSQFALWVAFFEIYNEYVYDLIQPSFCSKSKKRAALRVCDDGAGNAYVKDLRWINIQSLSEASKLLQFGKKNRSAVATTMNQSSSRSHSIFTMKLLKMDGNKAQRMSEFSLCDLAGSERCNKTKTFGERLKEAGNINNSLLILGKCINALRNNQTERMKNACIPFRESKLTKLFQAVFCGKGRASMIVNVSQCASTYDETLHVMKFSAVAKRVQVIPDKSLESLSQCLVGPNGNSLVRNGVIDRQALESFLSEDELLYEEEDADMSLLTQNELLDTIDNLRTKLLAERRRNLEQEMEIRKEMGDAMLQQIMESEELRSQQIEELKESYQEKMENTFEMYKDAIKEHAYKSAMSNLEDDFVPLDEFTAEQEKVEALERQLSQFASQNRACTVATADASCQCQPLTDFEAAGEECLKRLYKEKSAIEQMCEDKQQLILSLEKRLMELSKTLQTVRDGFLEKSIELEDLQVKTQEQMKSMQGIVSQSLEKDKEIASLKAELAMLTPKSPVPAKTKKGFLANIKEAVKSPHKTRSRTLRKTAETPRR
ncbi:kinesin-like protein KIF20A [Hippocampus zosterae]|uniref:kinesin-like protein KIF20A n=1 Tax=Hippocampus zosterae TaxID=109293 RepID=UPI00223E3222|nr:kinesin-like protein KIF20A [Hippocampus zosterae]